MTLGCERALKAAERDQAKAKKAEERQKKAEERQRIAEEKQKKAAERQTSAKRNHATETENRSIRKKTRLDKDETIHDNLCCVCYGSFDEDIGTGREWLQCSCKRWIHEDCIDTNDTDGSIDNKLCPLC